MKGFETADLSCGRSCDSNTYTSQPIRDEKRSAGPMRAQKRKTVSTEVNTFHTFTVCVCCADMLDVECRGSHRAQRPLADTME